MSTKYVFVTGGVVSGLGKGITAAVLGGLLKARGLSVRNQKFDPYINVDPSLMSPTQHGEIFVTADGAETDLDLGHYERFTDVELTGESDITTGKIYSEVINKERQGEYNGGTVQVVPHVINEIKEHIFNVSRQGELDVLISEIGGTIGDMESQPFIEAIRQVSYQVGRQNCLFVHVTLLPYLAKTHEIKTKPTQHSVKELLSYGIQPDILVCRCEAPIDNDLKKKIALYCNVKNENVIENRDMDTVYELPIYMEKQGLTNAVCKGLGIAQYVDPNLSPWENILDKIENSHNTVRVALVGKYTSLHDAYYSVIEALEHASINNEVKPEIKWVLSDSLPDLSEEKMAEVFENIDAIIIPGGFGPRGMDGMVAAAAYARRNKVPMFAIGLGMQMAAVDVARNLAGIVDAHSDECERECSDIFYYAGIDDVAAVAEIPFPERPMRRGSFTTVLRKGSKLADIYKSEEVVERHHHRREMNPAFFAELEGAGLLLTGMSEDGKRCNAFELKEHPFYIGSLYHPEFKSRPTAPHPLFNSFIKAAINYKNSRHIKNKK